jgi:hypothetical protein
MVESWALVRKCALDRLLVITKRLRSGVACSLNSLTGAAYAQPGVRSAPASAG